MKKYWLTLCFAFALLGCAKDESKLYEIAVKEGTTEEQLRIITYELDDAGDCVHTESFGLSDGKSRVIEADDNAVKVRVRVKGTLRIEGKVDACCAEHIILKKGKTVTATIKWNTVFEK